MNVAPMKQWKCLMHAATFHLLNPRCCSATSSRECWQTCSKKLRWQRNLARHASALFDQTVVHERVLFVLNCYTMQELCRLMACEKAGCPGLPIACIRFRLGASFACNFLPLELLELV